jgi:3-deoxy-D-manno-octulosonate 8-phosphate phosphatase (KDO 8-P phosphatase)
MINLKEIKACFLDVDGVLTDGTYSSGSHVANVSKTFFTRDFYAIEQCLRREINIIIITQSKSGVIANQIARLSEESDIWKNNPYLTVLTGIFDKEMAITKLLISKNDPCWDGVSWNNIAYIGDAEGDLKAMKRTSFTGCPSDAIDIIKEESHYVSDFPGGKGAVYDFLMHILDK